MAKRNSFLQIVSITFSIVFIVLIVRIKRENASLKVMEFLHRLKFLWKWYAKHRRLNCSYKPPLDLHGICRSKRFELCQSMLVASRVCRLGLVLSWLTVWLFLCDCQHLLETFFHKGNFFLAINQAPVFSRDVREKQALLVVACLSEVINYFLYFVVHGYYYRDKRAEVKG